MYHKGTYVETTTKPEENEKSLGQDKAIMPQLRYPIIHQTHSRYCGPLFVYKKLEHDNLTFFWLSSSLRRTDAYFEDIQDTLLAAS